MIRRNLYGQKMQIKELYILVVKSNEFTERMYHQTKKPMNM